MKVHIWDLNSSDNNYLDNLSKTFSVIKKDFLLPPPTKKFAKPKHLLNLNGQEGQPIKINDQIFKDKIKNGFYIEAGAYDGEMWSNSLFYEVEKGWNGLLVEAHPEAFGKMKKRVRTSYTSDSTNVLCTINRTTHLT